MDTTGAAIWDIGGIVICFVSRTVGAWLNVLLPGVFGWFSSSLVSLWSLRLATGFVFVKVPSWLRASIGITQWMELNALSSAFDSVNVLVHETGSDNDVYGERFGNDKWQMKQRVAETGSNEHHAEKS